MLGTWLERGGEGVEGVDRSLEGSQLQSPLVLLLLLQLEDMAGASFQTSLPGSGEREEEDQALPWDTCPGMGEQGHALTWGVSGRWVPKHQRAGREAGEHCCCHHLINACLARELPARESRGGCVRRDGAPGTLYHSPSPTELPGPPTHSGLHPPQVVCVGVQGWHKVSVAPPCWWHHQVEKHLQVSHTLQYPEMLLTPPGIIPAVGWNSPGHGTGRGAGRLPKCHCLCHARDNSPWPCAAPL